MEIKKDSVFIGILSSLIIFLFPFNHSSAQCINVFPHVEDFETAPTWTAVTAPTSSVAASSDWAWGTPNHTYVIQSAGSGNKCWSVGTLTGAFYNYWEQSYVVSPCYDFTTLLYPHIKFKLFYDCEYHFDGGNLQYSLNGGATWIDVGTVGGTNASPIPETNDCNTQNWYNYPGINYLNNPAGFVTSKHGWCGNTQAGGVGWDPASPATNCVGGNGTGQWITAEHCLTGCAGQPNVLLRFTFGSGFTCNNFDGFAFDSVAVSNGVPNSANFTHTCGGANTLNFTSTFAPCPQTNAWAWNFGDPASGGTNTAATQNASHTFNGPGSYTVTMIASGGLCNPPDTIKQVVNIMTASVTSFTDVSCNGGNNGAAIVTVNSGLPAVTYTWSPIGGSSANATGLTQGNYTVSVADAGSCPVTATVSIGQPQPIVITLSSAPSSCGSNNGSATATSVTGGIGPYTYSWTPTGGTGTTASNLNAATYTLTVTDNNLCPSTQTVTVNNSSGPQVTVTSTSVTCFGANTGSAMANVVGGTAPITYTWSPIGGNAAAANNLPAGTYTIVVTDASPCSVTNTLTIAQPAAFTVTATTTPANCGQANGTASVTATGATSPYTYTWSPSGGNSTNATGLSGGNYTVTISDANTCTTSAVAVVASTAPFTVAVNSTPVTCFGGTDGSATAVPNGSAGPFTYTWQAVGGNAATTGNILPMGTYTVNVTDNISGCTNTATVIVAQPATPVSVVANGQTICKGQTAAITANAIGGNGAPFSYAWNTGAATSSTTVTPIANTSYTVVATDSKDCPAGDTATVYVLPPLTIVVTSKDTVCPGQPATLSATAGGGNGNYTITWLPGNLHGSPITVTPNITTTYTATVTDGCTVAPASATGQVIVTPIPIVNFGANPASGCLPVCAVFAGITTNVPGNNVVSYNWSFGDGATGTGINTSHCYTVSGNYNVTLAGLTQKGCKDSLTITNLIHVFPQPHADFSASPSFVTDIYDNTIYFYDQSTGSTITTWHWLFPYGVTSVFQNPVFTFEPEGTYPVTLIVINSNGCADTITKEVIIKPDYTFYAPNAFTPNSDGMNEFFRPTGTAWDLNTYNLWVFDRWGNQIFYTKDTTKGWDGTRHGNDVQEDVYVWKVELKDVFGIHHEYNGHISIVK